MLRVGIVGASGYTGVELARLLAGHPEVEITVATSRQYAGKALAEVFPNLRKRVEVVCENLGAAELVDRADFFFTAVPHKTAMDIVPQLLAAGKKVVDLSADYRLHDVGVYQAWYAEHTSPELLAEAVYGLPELYRERVRTARLTANPGCYPTSVILALTPLLRRGLIDPATLIIDSKSGTTGAGRGAKVGSLFCEVTDNFKAYNLGKHRHTPEIEQELANFSSKKDIRISFSPHLLPINRGILSTMYANLRDGISAERIYGVYETAFERFPWLRLMPRGTLPDVRNVRGTMFCDVGLVVDQRTGRLIVVAAIDNLCRGASGQAIANANLMCGLRMDVGMTMPPLVP